MSDASRRSYNSAQKRYINFCVSYSLTPFPVNETMLCSFVSFLAQQGLKFQSIKCYLSGVRYLQIAQGFPDPHIGHDYPRLEGVLRGIKCVQAESNSNPRPRLPITPDIMALIQRFLPRSRDGSAIWAACCIGFFGFLHAGEFTVPSLKEYDSTTHLSLADIALDSHSAPTLLRVRIKASKTDPFCKGVDLFLGKTASSIYPITAMTAFLLQRGLALGPLFTLQDGSTLSRARLVTAVRCCLRAGGVNEEAYSGHSFRISAATTAAKKGIEDSMIQVLGRWQSAAYLRYVRIPRENLAAVSSVLVS